MSTPNGIQFAIDAILSQSVESGLPNPRPHSAVAKGRAITGEFAMQMGGKLTSLTLSERDFHVHLQMSNRHKWILY